MGAGPLGDLEEQTNDKTPSGLAERSVGRSEGSFLQTLKKEVVEVILVSIIHTHSLKTAHTYDLGHVPPQQSLK